ncbi:MAG: TorF family putative porin [Betaproteobacteria bacterium]
MKTAIRICAVAALLSAPLLAQAQGKAESDIAVSGNAGLFSDYRFRGFSQTGYSFAFQGGFDIAHKSGFYVGNWNSNVEQGLYNGANLELDLYAGYKTTLGDFGVDIGYLYYYYPKSGALGTTKVKNGEVYFGTSYGPLSAKFFYATTPFFSLGEPPTAGNADTKGSWYLDLTGNFDLGSGWGLVAHYGYQKIAKSDVLFRQGIVGEDTDSIADYRVGLTKDAGGWLLGANYVGTNSKNYFKTAESGFTKGAGKGGLVFSVAKTF